MSDLPYVESPDWTTIHTGNLCENCYQKVVGFVRGTNASLDKYH